MARIVSPTLAVRILDKNGRAAGPWHLIQSGQERFWNTWPRVPVGCGRTIMTGKCSEPKRIELLKGTNFCGYCLGASEVFEDGVQEIGS